MKDYLVTLIFKANGFAVLSSFHRLEDENAALIQALISSGHSAKSMTFQSVEEVNPDFCVLNSDHDAIADKNVIAIKVESVKASPNFAKELAELAKKYNLNNIVEALL